MTDSSYKGQGNVYRLLDLFIINSPNSNYIVLIFKPTQMSLYNIKVSFRPEGFNENFIRGTIIKLLKALNFLYTYGEIVYTSIYSINNSLELNTNRYPSLT